jgi:hypothetical protein
MRLMKSLQAPLQLANVLAVSAALIQGCAAPASGQKRIPPVMASLRVEQTALQLGDVADVTLRLTALAQVSRAEALVIVPPQMELVSGDRSWTGSMAANQGEELKLRLRLVQAGQFVLGARVVMLPMGGKSEETAGAVLYFVATPSQVIWGADPASLPGWTESPQGTGATGTSGVAVPPLPGPSGVSK